MADLMPNDIINKEFSVKWRGYATDQVDDFLQQVSDSLFHAMEENQRLRAQAEELRERVKTYQQTEDLIKSALVLAEQTASDARFRAEQDAKQIRRDAEEQVCAERATLEALKQTRHRILAELWAVLQSHLSMLESQERRLSNGVEESV